MEKFWWFAVCIQYDNQRKLQKKAPPILFGKNSRPADSFISENEGMNQPLANTSSDLAVRHLCAELNTTETLFPGTELRLIYDLVSSKNP